jgi:serine/threonine protein kinase
MQPEDFVGKPLGHYQIKRQIGHGGMAAVFLAEDIHLGREVALKVFWPRPGETQDFLRRFSREARVLAQLDHPHILPVYDYGEKDGLAFLVTPYLSGGTLKEMLKERKALPPSEAVQLIAQVLPALQYAHERNLIHRDIKPGNLLFKGNGNLVIADFGLVKVVEGESRDGTPLYTISETGETIAGTPEYMAPEQIDGRAVPASDIYSLGVVLYEMVTGVRPFTGPTLMSVLMKHMHEAPRSPRELNPYISRQLEAVILRALEKEPQRRFARPADLLQALQLIGNPSSNAGIVSLAAAASSPDLRDTPALPNEYGPTAAAGWEQATVTAPQPSGAVPQARDAGVRNQGASGGSDIAQPWTQVQPQVVQPLQQSSGPMSPFPPSQQQLGQSQTVPPMFAPPQQQPALPRRSRRPVIVLAVLLILLAGLVASLFLTPVGASLFGSVQSTPTAGPGSTPTSGAGTPLVRGGETPTPGTSTQAMPPTSTACPASGTARKAVIAPLALGKAATVVYTVNESDASGKPTYGTVKIYNTVTGQKRELAKNAQTVVNEAQISNDGQWVLFAATVAGQSELRLVRMDGQGQQTLLCAPDGMTIRGSQWSIDQKFVIFDEFPQTGEPTVYLLNLQTGSLQVEMTAPASGIALIPRTWLDFNRVLMVGIVPDSDAPPQNVYVLDTRNGTNQSLSGVQQVFASNNSTCWDFDSSYDASTLFTVQCTPAQPTGSSTISKQPANGGSSTTLLSSSTTAFNSVRVIEPHSLYLLATASDTGLGVTSGDPAHDGLYLLKTDGSVPPKRLFALASGQYESLNSYSQYFWSNVSRDGNQYAIQITDPHSANTYTLSVGSLDGGQPTAFVQFGQPAAIAGWTTM